MQLRDDSPSLRFGWPERLRRRAREVDLTLSQIARRAGSHHSMIYALASGKREGRSTLQGRIGDVLGAPAYVIFPRNQAEAEAADAWAGWEQ